MLDKWKDQNATNIAFSSISKKPASKIHRNRALTKWDVEWSYIANFIIFLYFFTSNSRFFNMADNSKDQNSIKNDVFQVLKKTSFSIEPRSALTTYELSFSYCANFSMYPDATYISYIS